MESVDPETGELYIRPELRICGHCCQQMRGYADLGGTWLCHTDENSCYNAVTLHHHEMRCTICDPLLENTRTWAETRARMARDWTAEQWAEWDRVLREAGLRYERESRKLRARDASEVRRLLGIDRLRAMYRRRKR